MKRKELVLQNTALLLLTGVFGLVDGEKWISINGENGSTYTTSGQAVNITCKIAIPYQPGAFISVNQAIWRAAGVSTELSPTSPQWSVVIDNFRRPGYTPDPARMSIWFGEHPSTTYMQIGLTIHVPFENDSGIYFCNGSYVAQSGASLIVDNSAQVYLSVTGTTQVATWITVNDWDFSSYFNTGLYQGDRFKGRFKLKCHSYVTDDNISIEEQYIMKYQSYLIDPLNGSLPYEYTTGSSRMEEFRINEEEEEEEEEEEKEEEEEEEENILMIGPTRPTKLQIISGFDFGLWCSNTGLYSCFTRYKVKGNSFNFAKTLNFTIVVTDQPYVYCYFRPMNKLGIEEDFDFQSYPVYGSFLTEATTVVVVFCYVKLCNEYPNFQVTVNDADVTSSLNISNNKPTVDDYREGTPGHIGVEYSLWMSLSLPVTDACRWQVTCRAWSPSMPSIGNTDSITIKRSCFEIERGKGLKSRASFKVVTSQKTGLIIWTMLTASLI